MKHLWNSREEWTYLRSLQFVPVHPEQHASCFSVLYLFGEKNKSCATYPMVVGGGHLSKFYTGMLGEKTFISLLRFQSQNGQI